MAAGTGAWWALTRCARGHGLAAWVGVGATRTQHCTPAAAARKAAATGCLASIASLHAALSIPSGSSLGLSLTRLVLVGFPLAPPGGDAPLLWPSRLVPPTGAGRLSMTDVRLVVDSQDLFNAYLDFFRSNARTLYWTVRGGCALREWLPVQADAPSPGGLMCA